MEILIHEEEEKDLQKLDTEDGKSMKSRQEKEVTTRNTKTSGGPKTMRTQTSAQDLKVKKIDDEELDVELTLDDEEILDEVSLHS